MNKRLRWINGNKWDVQESLAHLKRTETFLDEYGCRTISIDDIRPMLDLKFWCAFGTDKVGRPNLYCKMAGFLPNHATLQSCQKFMVAMMDYVSSKSYAYIDQFNFIFDWDGVGRNNFDITVTKGLIDVSGKLYTGKIYRFYQLNMHWGASLVFGMIKPLIPQRGRDKI